MKDQSNLLLLATLIYVFFAGATMAEDHAAKSFFPLKVGNTWITIDYSGIPRPYIQRYLVSDTVRFDDKLYFAIDMYGMRYFREDSSGRFFEYLNGQEQIIMNFSMLPGDSIAISQGKGSNGYAICIESKEVTTFIGTIGEQKEFFLDWDAQIIDEEETFVLQSRVGIFFYKPSFHISEYLLGALIDGVFYGDSTLVAVEETGQVAIPGYRLYQNYPNPFNPSTTFRFDLPKPSFVTLKIYNHLGQEIETVVNTFFPEGTYQLGWTAKGLATGPYFYQLQAGSFKKMNKFILLR